MHLKTLHLALPLALLSLSAPLLLAQTTPAVDQGYAGATMVSGHATPSQAPVVIYDATTSTRTALGSSQSIDKMGNFAVMVTSPLIRGHSIIVVDRSGATSAAMVVTPRPASVSHH